MSEPRPCIVRDGTEADAARVLEVWRAADAVPSITDAVENVATLARDQPGALLVAEVDGEVVATLIAGFDGWRANMYRLAVLPGLRRRGIARALVTEAERRLRARGVVRVTALAVDAHSHAVGLWEAAGYDRDERMVRYVKTLPG